MKIKKIIPVILVGMIVVMIFVNFMGRNEKMNEKPLSIGTEYGVQVNDKQLYTLTIDHISKVQTYLNHEIVIIDLTYQNNHIEENFIIDHKNFDVIDDADQTIEYIDCSLIHNKPKAIKKNQTYSAQIAYSIHKNTKDLFLKFHTPYTDDIALFQLPVYR